MSETMGQIGRKAGSIFIEVQLVLGTDIPEVGIPDLVALANRLGCSVRTRANDVTIIAHPGDDPVDLVLGWHCHASDDAKIVTARLGRQHR